MKAYRFFETVVGIAVIVVFIVFGTILFKKTDFISKYSLSQNSFNLYFRGAYGVQESNPVKLNGVNIGYVDSISLTENNQAKVKIFVNKKHKLPEDSTFSVLSQGFTGGQYINVSFGKSEKHLKNNADVYNTEDYKSLEDKIGEIINNLVN